MTPSYIITARFAQNSVETVRLGPENFHSRKLDEITVFGAVVCK